MKKMGSWWLATANDLVWKEYWGINYWSHHVSWNERGIRGAFKTCHLVHKTRGHWCMVNMAVNKDSESMYHLTYGDSQWSQWRWRTRKLRTEWEHNECELQKSPQSLGPCYPTWRQAQVDVINLKSRALAITLDCYMGSVKLWGPSGGQKGHRQKKEMEWQNQGQMYFPWSIATTKYLMLEDV